MDNYDIIVLESFFFIQRHRKPTVIQIPLKPLVLFSNEGEIGP